MERAAAQALRPGGLLVYFAKCGDGTGHPAIEEWVERFASSTELERELPSKFIVGGHKAYWIARLGEHTRILLVSGLPDPFVQKCHLLAVPDPEAAVEEELARLGSGARIAFIPHAGITLPSLPVSG